MKTAFRLLAFVAALVICSTAAFAQTTTGTLSGKVTDGGGLSVRGVTVTVESPSLQRVRTTTTSEQGDYLVPFLPAGEYLVTFELSGFQRLQRRVRLSVAANEPLNVKLAVAAVTESVTVSAAPQGDFTQTATVATSFKAEAIDRLPVARNLEGAVLLAPGTSDSGPGDTLMINGALSFENLFLVNGVVLNETLRGIAQPLYIEEAIEETKTSTGNISAEYGRFTGGVVNLTTKSGSNSFSGSFRTTLKNDDWRSLNPYERALAADPRIDEVVPVFEATLGGPILKNRLWVFSAGRFEDNTSARVAPYTQLAYEYGEKERRYEAKGTWTPFSGQTARLAYSNNNLKIHNRGFGDFMDAASLYDREDPQSLVSANYTAVVSPRFFLEGQFSQRRYSLIGSGSRYTDLIRGTMMQDRSRDNVRFNSPTFCAVCGAPDGELNEEKRDNHDILVKANYFLSTRGFGSHNFVAGFDAYDNMRLANTYGSGSNYRVMATSTIIVSASGQPAIYPVINSSTRINWTPLVAESEGGHLKTYSGFLNDVWRINSNLTVNLGVRYDRNDDRDQSGTKFTSDAALSPRVSLTFAPGEGGPWVVTSGFGRYVTDVAQGVSDTGSPAGRTATYSYTYSGPTVNQGLTAASPNLVATDAALTTLFDWFFANGGTNRALRVAPTIPGVNTRIDGRLVSPHADEFTAGISRTLGGKGIARVDAIIREYRDFYGQRRDTTTGKVSDTAGTNYDLALVVNTNDAKRNYRGIHTQLDCRLSPAVTVGGNYTLSWAKGNFVGEDTGGPTNADMNDYPEYRRDAWNFPVGYLTSDQRHKVRAWTTWRAPLPERAGRLDIGLLQRFNSGYAYSAAAIVATSAFVSNPGYTTPPAATTYYFGGRGAYRTDNLTRTDLSLNYAFHVTGLSGNTRTFVKLVVNNVFNNAAVTAVDTTVFTNDSDATLTRFNPFTETPVEGTHWRKGPDFGRPVAAGAYQAARSFNVAVGVRF